jgi:hypothetical protein
MKAVTPEKEGLTDGGLRSVKGYIAESVNTKIQLEAIMVQEILTSSISYYQKSYNLAHQNKKKRFYTS